MTDRHHDRYYMIAIVYRPIYKLVTKVGKDHSSEYIYSLTCYYIFVHCTWSHSIVLKAQIEQQILKPKTYFRSSEHIINAVLGGHQSLFKYNDT